MDADIGKTALQAKHRGDFRLYYETELSEADTRCKLVDALLTDVLGWTEPLIEREPKLVESVRYIDYVLTTTRPVLIIEAKRHGDSFKLPKTSSARRRFKLGGVLSEDKELKAAILQAQVYAISKGVPICVVTNGTQFVIFRAQNELGVDFWSHEAVVFDSIDDVLSNFLQFYDCLSFESVTHARHLKSIPISSQEKNVGRLYRNVVPRIAAERVRNRNKLFDFIREVIVNVFQDLASSNASEELIEQCYVESARDSGYEQSLRALLKNRPKLP